MKKVTQHLTSVWCFFFLCGNGAYNQKAAELTTYKTYNVAGRLTLLTIQQLSVHPAAFSVW